jgi:hypothetical protein
MQPLSTRVGSTQDHDGRTASVPQVQESVLEHAEANDRKEAPQPIATKFVPGGPGIPNHGEATFDCAELRDYVLSAPKASWLVRDRDGNPLGIARADLIRELFSETTPDTCPTSAPDCSRRRSRQSLSV